jgi:uncharacterized protein YqeY
MLEQKIEQDLKTALLASDAQRVSVLRGLKSVLLNVKVAEGKRDSGLSDDEVLAIFAKEAKKRQESADLYKQGDRPEKADAELAEKAIIEEYLPAQLGEAEISRLVEEAIKKTGAESAKDMGKVIGQVRQQAGASADGSLIAKLAKEKLGA